jgi:hypothetical protein
LPKGEPIAEGTPQKPPWINGGRVAELWSEVVAVAPWLRRADSFKLGIWAALMAEFERTGADMTAAKLTQLRIYGAELGLDPGSRVRLATGRDPEPDDPAKRFLG